MYKVCPDCGSPVEIETFDDGSWHGVQYWDIKYSCTNEDCGWDDWESRQEFIEEDPDVIQETYQGQVDQSQGPQEAPEAGNWSDDLGSEANDQG